MNPSAHFVRTGKLTAPIRPILTPGRALVARPEFAGAAVNAALVTYLRRWRSGTYLPNFEVPAVRDALTKLVADAYDIRKLEREIVTSLLYVQSATAAPGASALTPLWAYGPTKPLYAEAWEDTLAQAIGTPSGTAISATRPPPSMPTSRSPASPTPSPSRTPITPSTRASSRIWAAVPTPPPTPTRAAWWPPSPAAARWPRSAPWAWRRRWSSTASSTFDTMIDAAFVGVGRPAAAAERQILVEQMSVVANAGCDPTKLASCDLQSMSDGLCRSLYATALFNFY